MGVHRTQNDGLVCAHTLSLHSLWGVVEPSRGVGYATPSLEMRTTVYASRDYKRHPHLIVCVLYKATRPYTMVLDH